MTDMAAMDINLKMEAHNFELINAKQTKESLVHGKIYVDVNAMLKGRPDALTMRGNMNILGSSDFTYVLKDSPLTVEDRLNSCHVCGLQRYDSHSQASHSCHVAGRYGYFDDTSHRRGCAGTRQLK